MAKTYYKTVRQNRRSWHGNIQYNVGETVSLPVVAYPVLCTDTVLHASEKPLDALKYAGDLDCKLLEVSGDEIVHEDDKCGFFSLSVVREVPNSEKDALYGFSYNEVINPVIPYKIKCKLTDKDRENLKQWVSVSDSIKTSISASVSDSVRVSVRASASASILNSIRDSVMDSVMGSIWNSVRASVIGAILHSSWNSVRASVWYSVEDSAWAYIGSLFPAIDKWAYIDHKNGDYPFQPGVDLWKRGFIPTHVNGRWILYHPVVGKPAKLVWEGF